jgi:SAM-dependent methyltransferase
VLGVDFSDVAIEQARAISVANTNVIYQQADILELNAQVTGSYQLVVLADVLYYLSPLSDSVLKSIREMVCNAVVSGGTLLLVNHSFFRIDHDSRMTRQMHDCYRWSGAFELQREQWYPFFLASVLRKR